MKCLQITPAAETPRNSRAPGSGRKVPEGSLPLQLARAAFPGRAHAHSEPAGSEGTGRRPPHPGPSPRVRDHPVPRRPRPFSPDPGGAAPSRAGPWGPRGGQSPQLTERRPPVRDQPDTAPTPRGATRVPARPAETLTHLATGHGARGPRGQGDAAAAALSAGVRARRLGRGEFGPRSARALGVLARRAPQPQGGAEEGPTERKTWSLRSAPRGGAGFRGGARLRGVVCAQPRPQA